MGQQKQNLKIIKANQLNKRLKQLLQSHIIFFLRLNPELDLMQNNST